jgi:hypothetical protein
MLPPVGLGPAGGGGGARSRGRRRRCWARRGVPGCEAGACHGARISSSIATRLKSDRRARRPLRDSERGLGARTFDPQILEGHGLRWRRPGDASTETVPVLSLPILTGRAGSWTAVGVPEDELPGGAPTGNATPVPQEEPGGRRRPSSALRPGIGEGWWARVAAEAASGCAGAIPMG